MCCASRVIDQGPGIPKRLRERVFQPFVRVSNRLEDPAGTGIGLSIARGLARRHGGDCTLEASPQGCSFSVKLALQPPFHHGEVESVAEEPTSPRPPR